MKKELLITVTVLLLFGLLSSLQARSREEKRLQNSIDVLTEIVTIPDKGIPEALLKRARGIAVIPDMIRGGLGVGGRYGKGVIAVRNEDGCWTLPFFISITGGSIGAQIGGQAVNLVLVFMSRKSVEDIFKGKYTLGADASVAAGPVGRQAGAETDIELKAEILSYSQTRGVFAGIAVQGARIGIDKSANKKLYEQSVSAEDIINGKIESPPQLATMFQSTIAGAAKNDSTPENCNKGNTQQNPESQDTSDMQKQEKSNTDNKDTGETSPDTGGSNNE